MCHVIHCKCLAGDVIVCDFINEENGTGCDLKSRTDIIVIFDTDITQWLTNSWLVKLLHKWYLVHV